MKLDARREQAVIDANVDFAAALRAAADDYDALPAWRRWLVERLSERRWGYALRVWADLWIRQRDDK